ncbi:hypothetical protein R0595_001467 [Pluralibacter gergoviae]|nr:hypothetical protein [Pluralibacter gergoviae]ELW9441018.1 hypothetical protein [Pluralibacter gergoviae]
MSKNNNMQLQLPILVEIVSDASRSQRTKIKQKAERQHQSSVSGRDDSIYSAMANRYLEQLARLK